MSNTENEGGRHERSAPHNPLDGAAIGETRAVRESKTLHGINFEPDSFYGSDRQWRSGPEIVDIEVVENEGGSDDIRVTWEADVTKRLPRYWDRANEPRTVEEEKSARRKKWIGRVGRAALVVIPLGVATFVAGSLMTALDGSMTINGEPVTTTWTELLPALALVFALAFIIMWGIRGGFPGGMGGRRYA